MKDLECRQANSAPGLFYYEASTRRPWFPTRLSNLHSSYHRTLFHFKTLHFKWALAHRTRRRFWTMFTYGFLFAWYSFSWHLQIARRIVFTDSGFGKYSWAHLVMSITETASSEGPKTTGIQQRSSALSLTHRDFSSFSESFDDVMPYRWWDLQSLCNLTLRNAVFKVFHNLFTHSVTDRRASVHLYIWEALPF